MTYQTKAAQDLVDKFQCRLARLEESLWKETDTFRRLADTAWLDATKAALHDVYLSLDEIEEQAKIVPSEEENYLTHVQREAEMDMAGDYRDWPAA